MPWPEPMVTCPVHGRKFGPCPFCRPAEAEEYRFRRLAVELAAEEERSKRWCRIHYESDHCQRDGWTEHAEDALRASVEQVEARSALTWTEAMAQLRQRYRADL